MRPWWINAIKTINLHGMYPYKFCNLTTPEPLFHDKTQVLFKWEEDLANGSQASLDKALRNQNVMLPNVLCPFGCSTYLRTAKYASWEVIIQQYLSKVVLPLSSTANIHKFSSMSPFYFLVGDNRANILGNREWTVDPTIIFTNDGPQILTCEHHGGGDDHLCIFPPQEPGLCLPARYSDQLSHVVAVPRIKRPTIARANNTTFSMSQQGGGFSGLSSMNITTHSNWGFQSLLLSRIESCTLNARDDIVQLLSQKVEAKQIPQRLANNMLKLSSKCHPEGHLDKYRKGSSFVPVRTIIKLHLAQSHADHDSGLISVKTIKNEIVHCQRPWSQAINIVQTEDSERFGSTFRSIPAFRCYEKAGMMTWVLCSILSSVSNLWESVDTKHLPFEQNGWEYWLLSFIQLNVFPFDVKRIDRRSPFKRLKNAGDLIDVVNRFAPVPSNTYENDNDPDTILKFSCEFMRNIFCPSEYSTIMVEDSVTNAITLEDSHLFKNTKIIIVVGSGLPEVLGNDQDLSSSGKLVFSDGTTFELLSVAILRGQSIAYSRQPNKFDAIRYMRHGGYYTSWQKQERFDKVVMQCTENICDILINAANNSDHAEYDFLQHVLVYVKEETLDADQWKLKILESLGGKTHVQCACNNFPLIPTNAQKGEKGQCYRCCRFESFVCCHQNCHLKVCRNCYNSFPLDRVTIISPSTHPTKNGDSSCINKDLSHGPGDNNSESDCEEVLSYYDSDSNDTQSESDSQSCFEYSDKDINSEYDILESGFESDNECVKGSKLLDILEEEQPFDGTANYLTHANIDASYPQTDDNVHMSAGFLTTVAGDIPLDVEQDLSKERVSGHVLYNQAAVCTTHRGDRRIKGLLREQHFIQSYCATTPSQCCPLLSLEQCLSPRIFWSSASSDNYAVLGALPTWLYGNKAHVHGFAKIQDITRTRLTTLNSLSSTCPHYLRFQYDILSNIALSNGNSRDIINRGFQVDAKSPTGLVVRNKGQSTLSESVDSRDMVRGLSASQEWIKWDWFITFTGNHSMTPGLSFLHQWKNLNNGLINILTTQR